MRRRRRRGGGGGGGRTIRMRRRRENNRNQEEEEEEEEEVDCLQSVFSFKIHLVLISSSAIANHDVIITIERRREKTDC